MCRDKVKDMKIYGSIGCKTAEFLPMSKLRVKSEFKTKSYEKKDNS